MSRVVFMCVELHIRFLPLSFQCNQRPWGVENYELYLFLLSSGTSIQMVDCRKPQVLNQIRQLELKLGFIEPTYMKLKTSLPIWYWSWVGSGSIGKRPYVQKCQLELTLGFIEPTYEPKSIKIQNVRNEVAQKKKLEGNSQRVPSWVT